LRFPAALDWLRITDVLRVAASGRKPASRKAFDNRWPDKDSFMRDAVIYTMCYRDVPERDPYTIAHPLIIRLGSAPSVPPDVRGSALELFSGLLRDPRTFLLMHLTPILRHHPDVHREVVRKYDESRLVWQQGLAALITQFDVRLRPGWSVERLDRTLAALLDGCLLAHRLHDDDTIRDWEAADLFAEAVVALLDGVSVQPPSDASAVDAPRV
jgi:AcrR family transcriptional regulator